MGKSSKQTIIWVVGVILIVLGAMFFTGSLKFTPQTTTNVQSVGQVQGTASSNLVDCNQLSATYSAVDAFSSSTTVTGTERIKSNGLAPVSSLATPPQGKSLTYWNNNGSRYICDLASVENVVCGANQLQAKCYNNDTVTLKVFDEDNNVFLTANGGANNITVGANGKANLNIRYQETSKKPSMPLGGCMVIEYPATFTDVSVSGSGISSATPCQYKYTYTTTSTSNTYVALAVPAGFDKDGLGLIKQISLQMKSGSSDPTGTVYVRFQPANYYETNDGTFALGIEKDKNQDTTKTFGSNYVFVADVD